MKVIVNIKHHFCRVIKEKGDRIYREPLFYYKLKEAMQAQGHKVIKKEMVKDDHMVSEGVYYVRERGGAYGIYDPNANARSTYKAFNEAGEVSLTVEYLKDVLEFDPEGRVTRSYNRRRT